MHPNETVKLHDGAHYAGTKCGSTSQAEGCPLSSYKVASFSFLWPTVSAMLSLLDSIAL